MRDMLQECNSEGHLSQEEFEATFCQRCKQPNCPRAAWGRSKMDVRAALQVQRLLHPTQVDPTLSQYAHLVDFDSVSRRVRQREIADARGDWEVPDVDGIIEVAPSASVEAAVMAIQHEMAKPQPVEKPTPAPEPTPEPARAPPVIRTLPVGFVPPTAVNAPIQQGAMVGGAAPPAPQAAPPVDVDPWAVPEHLAPKTRKVQVGATVQMGSSPRKK